MEKNMGYGENSTGAHAKELSPYDDLPPIPAVSFRIPKDIPVSDHIRNIADMKENGRDSGVSDYLLCCRCFRLITDESERIVVNSLHAHTFSNPLGQVFEIGCFRSAPGIGLAGQPSNEFSWFSGYSWIIAVCGTCLSHIGWHFVSSGNSFTGLILDRLISSGKQKNEQ